MQIIHASGYSSYYLLNSAQINRIVTDAPLQTIVQLYHQVLQTSSWPDGITVVFWQIPIEVYSYNNSSLLDFCRKFVFTREAVLWDWQKEEIIDYFNGLADDRRKLIRTREEPEKAFAAHPSAILKSVYLSGLYGYKLSEKLIAAAGKQAHYLKLLKTNDIRDYLVKILLLVKPGRYLKILQEIGVFSLFLPELEKAFSVWITSEHNLGEHSIYIADYLPQDINLRLAGLFHDLSKTEYEKGDLFFSEHENKSAQMAKKILDRLNLFLYLGGQNINHHLILNLIRNHMFSYEKHYTTKKAIERLISRVGLENIENLLLLREANRKAGSVSKQCCSNYDTELKHKIKQIIKNY